MGEAMTTLREKLQARAERVAEERFPMPMYIESALPKVAHDGFKEGHADTHEMIEALVGALMNIEEETGTPYALIATAALAKFQAWLEEEKP